MIQAANCSVYERSECEQASSKCTGPDRGTSHLTKVAEGIFGSPKPEGPVSSGGNENVALVLKTQELGLRFQPLLSHQDENLRTMDWQWKAGS